MSVRGTSNQSIKTVTKSVLSQGYECGPTLGGGGAGFSNAGWVEYRESDNAPGSGTVFTKGSDHLAAGTPQAEDQTP